MQENGHRHTEEVHKAAEPAGILSTIVPFCRASGECLIIGVLSGRETKGWNDHDYDYARGVGYVMVHLRLSYRR